MWLFACATPEAPGPAAPTAAPKSEIAKKTEAFPARFELGRAATAEEVAAWDKEVDPSWNGLPPGRGSVAEGKALYAVKCAFCHNVDLKGGEGFTGPRLVATEPHEGFGASYSLPRTVGNYWPHASSVYDYIYRSMPQNAPGSLSPDETYALLAYVLSESGVVPADFVADQDSVKGIAMPVKARFVMDDRESVNSFR